MPASRDSDLVQPMQSRTSSTKKGRSISSKSQVASQLQQQVPRRRPVVPSPRPVAALPAPKWNARHPERPASWRFAERPAQNARACGFPGRCRAFWPGVRRAFCLALGFWRPVAVASGQAAADRRLNLGHVACRGVFGLIKQPKGLCSSPGVWGERELASRGHLPCLPAAAAAPLGAGSAPRGPAAAWLVLARRPAGTSAGGSGRAEPQAPSQHNGGKGHPKRKQKKSRRWPCAIIAYVPEMPPLAPVARIRG